ncbi:MAG: hypothetical protein AABY86_13755, partial [Bdellovibrionota bacterium]
LVMTVMMIDVAARSAANTGVLRAVFLTAAGIQALAGMGFLWKAYDYLSGVIPDLEILVAALKKTLTNEGVALGEGDWTKAKEHLNEEDMSAKEIKKYDPCTTQANKNNPDVTATPIPTPLSIPSS